MNEGLTSDEMIKWMDSIVKANDTQISFMWLHFQEHIKNRVKAREEMKIKN